VFFKSSKSQTACNTVDMQDLSSTSGTLLNQMLPGNFSGNSNYAPEPTGVNLVPLSRVDPDCDQNAGEMSKMKIVCRCDLSPATYPREKTSGLLESDCCCWCR